MARWTNGGHGDMDVGSVADDEDDVGGVGFVKYGPMDVREKMRDANAVVTAAYREIVAAYDKDHKAVPADYLHQLTLFWYGWTRFYERFDGLPGAVGQWRDSTYERADLYTRTALAFLEGYKKKTWLKAAVVPPAPKKAGDEAVRPVEVSRTRQADNGKWQWWQWALLAGVVGGGSYAAYRVWPRAAPAGRHEISDAEAIAYLRAKGGA